MLSIEVLSLLFKTDPRTGAEVRRGVTNRVLKVLGDKADLDGIAALAILLREAAEQGRSKMALAVGEALYRAILHAASRGNEQLRCVVPRIFAMLIQRVFPFACDRTRYLCFQGVTPENLCQLFVFECQRRNEQFISKGSLQPSDVDMVIFPGGIGPFGFLHFSPPVRERANDENYWGLVGVWETATKLLRERAIPD